MTIITSEDRAAPEFAASVMERMCPSPRDRLLVLRQLLNSIDVALSVSADIWALTLFQTGFRLNVGPVEVMTFNVISEGSPSSTAPAAAPQTAKLFEIRLLLHGEIADDVLQSIDEGKNPHQILASHYKSVPQPQFFYVCSTRLNSGSLPNDDCRQIERALALLAPQHAAFVWHAAHTLRGKTRRTSNLRRSHSQGLYRYATNFVRGNLQPAIEQHDDAHSLGRSSWTFQEELPSDEPLVEGASFTVKVNAFERNPLARQKCVAHHGTVCAVCGFSFACAYGSVAAGYVHVHHLNPLASIGKEYVIDPIKDLRPVCANCHAVIHLRQPPYSIEEVKRMRTDSK